MDVLRKAQDELIGEIRGVAVRWCARRHKMVEAMFDLSLTSLHNAGRVETAEACMRWYNGSLERLSEDANDQMELAVTVAKHLGKQETACFRGPPAPKATASRSAKAGKLEVQFWPTKAVVGTDLGRDMDGPVTAKLCILANMVADTVPGP